MLHYDHHARFWCSWPENCIDAIRYSVVWRWYVNLAGAGNKLAAQSSAVLHLLRLSHPTKTLTSLNSNAGPWIHSEPFQHGIHLVLIGSVATVPSKRLSITPPMPRSSFSDALHLPRRLISGLFDKQRYVKKGREGGSGGWMSTMEIQRMLKTSGVHLLTRSRPDVRSEPRETYTSLH